MAERDVIRAVLDYLAWKKVLAWRNQSGIIFISRNGKNYAVRQGVNGVPDIVALQNGKVYGLECKDAKGKQSDEQKQFQKRWEQQGGLYAIIRSVEDVQSLGL